MLLPLTDRPNLSDRRAWVNYALIAANIGAFLWARSAGAAGPGYDAIVREWGFVPVAGRLETCFTSMFMHADFLHLGGNMLFLWIFGDNVEGYLGHVGYLAAYLSAGLAAVLLFEWLSPGSTIPLVGASGAIMGVVGIYFLVFPRNHVRVLILFYVVTVQDIRARYVLGFYFVLDFFNLMVRRGEAGGGVAYAAHVGGFAFGLCLAAIVSRMRPRPDGPSRARRGSARFDRARR